MNMADRIQYLRKSKGISQEELADKVGVSRQAVSKWESEQSTPDLEKIIIMSDFFMIKSPFLTRILTHSLYYGNRMQRVCPTSAALFRCGRGDSKNKPSLRQKHRRRTTTKIKEERT